MENQFDLGLNIASIETELPDPVITLSGADILTASDTAEMPLLSLTAYGRSTQGYASHGGEPLGKNLIPYPYNYGSMEISGLTFTVNSDRSITVKGTSTELATFRVYGNSDNTTPLTGVTGGNTYAMSSNVSCMITNSQGETRYTNKIVNLAEDEIITYVYIQYPANTTVDAILKPQIEIGNTSTDYEPYYSNPNPDCPVAIENIGDSGSLAVTTCGKNLLNVTADSKTSNGVTFTVNDNKSVTANGMAPTEALGMLEVGTIMLKANTEYILSGCPVGGNSVDKYRMIMLVNGVNISTDTGNGVSVRVEEDTIVTVRIDVITGYMATNLVFKPMLRFASIADDTFEPYKSTTAEITAALPLCGIPVGSGGNYTDSSGQEWICDTLEHVYGETAQVIKRIKSTSVKYTVEDHGGEAVMIHTKSGKRYFTYGEYGRYNKNASTTLKYTLYNCIYRVTCNADTGEILSEETLNGGALSFYTTYTEQVVGDWCYSSTTDLVEWAIPLRQLENGDPLPSEYISVTGELSSGAQIIYPSEAKALTLTTKETESLSALSGYESSTTIYNNNTAEMKVKLLRKDFEMQYIHWIKESQSFICEKSGKYKIICVGGGSSGGIGAAGAADVLQAAGTTTSFGNIISANGGGRSKTSASENFKAESTVGGQSGYDGINYGSSSHVLRAEVNSCLSSSGGESTVMWGTGHGYGAGGGAKGTSLTYTAGTSTSIEFIACGGQCGKIESTIVDLEENQTVFCTVGGGGVLNLSDENVLEYIVNYVHSGADECSKTGAELSACVTDGADGVIIVQYLGI